MISAPLQVYELYSEKLLAPEPYLWIPVNSGNGYRPIHFFIDTGAPITTIPDFIADANRIVWNRRKKRLFAGPSGVTSSFLNEIEVQVDDTIRKIPCLIYEPISRGRKPAILGRAGVIDTFSIRFDTGSVEIEPY